MKPTENVGNKPEKGSKQWNAIFKESGEVFHEVQEDMPRVVEILKERGAETVLDLGCGAGRHSEYIAKEGLKVSGFDGSDAGIEITKKRVAAAEGVEAKEIEERFKVGDLYDKKGLPYPDESFDALISTQVVHHNTIDKIRGLIQEMRRILKQDGTIFVTVIKGDLKYAGPVDKVAPNTFAPKEGREKGLPHHYFNSETLRDEFEKEGFKIGKADVWEEVNSRRAIHICLLGKKAKPKNN